MATNHRKRWSESDDQQLIMMYAAHVGISVIAQLLGRTEVSILHRLSTHGLVYFDREENAYFTAPAKLYQF